MLLTPSQPPPSNPVPPTADEQQEPAITDAEIVHAEDDGPIPSDDGGVREGILQDLQEAEFSVEGKGAGRVSDEPVRTEPAKPKSTLIFGTKKEALPDRAAQAEQMMAELNTEHPEPSDEPASTQGLAPVNRNNQLSFQQAQSPKDLLAWGTLLHQSNVFPSVKSPQEAVARILMARSLQIDEMKAMYMLHPIDGKLVLSADLTRFLLDRAGVRWKIINDHSYFANANLVTNAYPNGGAPDYLTKIRMKHDATGKDVTWEVWWSDLQPFWSGKNKATWDKFPKPMHLHAAVRQCSRFYFPAILGGFYEADELGHSEGDTFAQEA